MFGLTKVKLERNLNGIGNYLCAYGGGEWKERYCDCKFGEENEECKGMRSENFSGCPEIRQVLRIIKSISEDEFKEFCKKAGIQIIGE